MRQEGAGVKSLRGSQEGYTDEKEFGFCTNLCFKVAGWNDWSWQGKCTKLGMSGVCWKEGWKIEQGCVCVCFQGFAYHAEEFGPYSVEGCLKHKVTWCDL